MKAIPEKNLLEMVSNLIKSKRLEEAALIQRLIDEELEEIDTLTVSNKPALERFNEIEMEVNEKESPLERLRFFCSLAMTGQDWLDSEKFFDDIENVDALTVKQLRPMCEATKEGYMLLHMDSGDVLREGFFYDGVYIVDGCELEEDSLDGWIPAPIYKPEKE